MSLTKDSVSGNTICEIRDQLEQLLQFVDKSAQDALQLYDVERRVFDEVLKLGHKCVEVFIGLQGPMILEDTKQKPAMDDSQERPGNRKMATIAAVYSVDPYVRSPADVIAALFRDDFANKDYRRPKPQFKLVTAHFPEIYQDAHKTIKSTGTNEAFAWMAGEVARRRKRKQTSITLLDGDPKLWNKLPEFLPADTIGILDIIHVTQYVWKAAKVFCKSPDAISVFAREASRPHALWRVFTRRLSNCQWCN